MNILVINGSPRTLGSCDRLVSSLLQTFTKEDGIKILKPFEMNITPCNACGYCKAADGCSKKDMEEFFAYYGQADVVIVASPVYNYSMPAPMKALFDRFQRIMRLPKEAKNHSQDPRLPCLS